MAMVDVDETATAALCRELSAHMGKPDMTVRFGSDITRRHIGLAQDRVGQVFDQHLARLQKAGCPVSDAASDRKQWQTRIAGVLQRASNQHGWKSRLFGEFSFEPGNCMEQGLQSPPPIKLAMVKSDISSGAMGSVSSFVDPEGRQYIGKRLNPEMARNPERIGDPLEHEWAGFRNIQEKAGPHPNLVQAYGIGRFEDGEEPTLLMDHVPGMSGTDTFTALRRCLDTGRISYAEYTEAIKSVVNGLLNAVGHMGKAGVVHLDIKPDNFILHEKTGEPVLIDPGLWAARDELANSGTPNYGSPEAFDPKGRMDERSDVFSVAASLVQAWEGNIHDDDGRRRRAGQGLRKGDGVRKDMHGNAVRRPGVYGAETAYTRFLDSTLAEIRDAPEGARRGPRPDSAQAKALEYLSDRMLDDDAAKAVLKKVMTIAREEAQKPQGEQWKFQAIEKPVSDERFDETQRMLDELGSNSRWETYASLIHYSRTDPELKRVFDEGRVKFWRSRLENGAAHSADWLIKRGEKWADAARFVAEWGPQTGSLPRQAAVKSGVHTNGVRLNVAAGGASEVRASWAVWAREQVAPHVSLDELREYAAKAEVYLADVETLRPIESDKLKTSVERIRQLAQDARRVLELSGPGERRPGKPGNGEIRGAELRSRLEQFMNSPKVQEKLRDMGNMPSPERSHEDSSHPSPRGPSSNR